jgi:type II secretory pathway component PulF
MNIFKLLPPPAQLWLATTRFRSAREAFYRETRLDIDKKGFRNSETLVERVSKHLERDRARDGWTWPVYERILKHLRAGDPFAAAMKRFVPHDEYALLEISSTSTEADAVVRGFELAEMTAAAKRTLRGSVNAEIAYPMMLLVFMYVLACIFGGYVFPDMRDIVPADQWVGPTVWLYSVDTFCYRYWWLVGGVVASTATLYFYSVRNWAGPTRNRIDRLPFLYRNNRDLKAALLLVSFAGLFDSNVPLRQAINRLLETADPWLRWHLTVMSARLSRYPNEPMKAMDSGIFSQSVVDTVTDAAGRDQFQDAIKHLGRNSIDTIVAAIKRNARITHYVMLLIAGLLFIAIGLGSYAIVAGIGMQSYNTPH